MKSKLLLSLFLLAGLMAFNSKETKAQITAVTVDSFFVYSPSNCLTPTAAFVNLSGHITGTATANDSVTLHVDFGDGNDTTFKAGLGQGYYWTFFEHVYQIAGTFTPLATVTTSNNLTATLTSPTFTLSNNCAPVSGRIYVDANNNCTFDAGELTLNSFITAHNTATNTDNYASPDINGIYHLALPPGNYDLTPGNNYYGATVAPTCPSSGTVNITVTSGGTYTNNFAFSCSSSTNIADASLNASAWNWRPGFTRPLYISLSSNSPCLNTPGTLTVTLPTDLSYASTNYGVAPTAVSGNTLNWSINNLSYLNGFYTSINVFCATTATFGDTLCVPVVFTPVTPDANSANNSETICVEVNNSMDPNDKHVDQGEGATGDIVNGTQLDYLINFQNTGNDMAYTVTVKDEIDADLNLSTFKLMATSHPVKVTVVGRQINFRFDNINLPDSGANEPQSHGFIAYRIMPKSNLALGTTINNTADIYFDYNDPIITNTTLNTIVAPQSIQQLTNGSLQATVYPNPAHQTISIELKEKENFSASLYDMLGRTATTVHGRNGNATINVNELPAGLYLLRVSNAHNQVLTTKINILH